MKEALSGKKETHKAMCQSSTEENKRRYESIKNNVDKAVSKAMREKAEETLTELQNFQYWMFMLVKRLKTDSKEVDGGGCMRGSDGRDGRLCFSIKEEDKFWKDYIYIYERSSSTKLKLNESTK